MARVQLRQRIHLRLDNKVEGLGERGDVVPMGPGMVDIPDELVDHWFVKGHTVPLEEVQVRKAGTDGNTPEIPVPPMIDKMDEKELAAFCENAKLKIDLDQYKKINDKRKAVQDAFVDSKK